MYEANPREVVVISRLADARRRRNLSQATVAKLIGIHRPSLSLIESGQQQLTVNLLLKLCDAYSLHARDIMRAGDSLACSLADQMRDEAREGLRV